MMLFLLLNPDIFGTLAKNRLKLGSKIGTALFFEGGLGVSDFVRSLRRLLPFETNFRPFVEYLDEGLEKRSLFMPNDIIRLLYYNYLCFGIVSKTLLQQIS